MLNSNIITMTGLKTVTLPYTATKNTMMNVRFKTANNLGNDKGGYLYLRSSKYGYHYYSYAGQTHGGQISDWFPVEKGDTIFIDTSANLIEVQEYRIFEI